MKRKKIIGLFILILTFGMSINFNIQNEISDVSGGIYTSGYDGVLEGFEEDSVDFPTSVWSFAHESYFSQSTARKKEGSKSLVATGSDGRNYDGVEYYETFSDGSIEAWVYSESSWLIPAIWIRTSDFDTTTNPSFKNGYMLRLYVDKAYLQRRDTTNGWTELDSFYVDYINGKWWHLKLEADGNNLKAWVTRNDEFDENPDLDWNISGDSVKFYRGKAGISARTNMNGFYTHYDKIIISPHTYKISETFTTLDYQDVWEFANPSRFTRTFFTPFLSFCLKSVGPDGQSYDGAQFNWSFVDGSIEGRFYVDYSYTNIPALWIRASDLDYSSNPSFDDGYVLRLYKYGAKLRKCDNGDWTDLGDEFDTGLITNKVWHLKLQARGNLIEAWVQENNDFDCKPQIYYDTESDAVKFESGKAGFSTRTTNSYPIYIDSIKIILHDNDPWRLDYPSVYSTWHGDAARHPKDQTMLSMARRATGYGWQRIGYNDNPVTEERIVKSLARFTKDWLTPLWEGDTNFKTDKNVAEEFLFFQSWMDYGYITISETFDCRDIAAFVTGMAMAMGVKAKMLTAQFGSSDHIGALLDKSGSNDWFLISVNFHSYRDSDNTDREIQDHFCGGPFGTHVQHVFHCIFDVDVWYDSNYFAAEVGWIKWVLDVEESQWILEKDNNFQAPEFSGDYGNDFVYFGTKWGISVTSNKLQTYDDAEAQGAI